LRQRPDRRRSPACFPDAALVLIGFAGPGGQSRAAPERRTWPDLGVAVFNMTDDPLGILRACLALQLTGFAVL